MYSPFTHFSHPSPRISPLPPMAPGNHQSVLYICKLLFFLFYFEDSPHKRELCICEWKGLLTIEEKGLLTIGNWAKYVVLRVLFHLQREFC